MNIELPAIPAGVMTLLAFFSPYAIAIINHPRWSTGSKRLITIAATVALAFICYAGYILLTGDTVPDWPVLILLFLVISQTAYSLVLKGSVKRVEQNVGVTDGSVG